MKTKKLVLVFLTLLVLTLTVLPTAATTYAEDHLVVDNADLLSESEKQRVLDRVVEFIEETGWHLTIVTDTVRYDDYNTPAVIDSIPATDLIVLTVSYTDGTYYYYLYTYGDTYYELTDGDVNAILDANAVYNNLKGGHICDGVLAFIDKTESRTAAFVAKWEDLPTILAVSLIVAAICCGIVVAKYKMKLKPTNYPLDKFTKLELTEQSDIFTGSFVTKRRVSSSSSGSRGGGRSGGGRSGGGRGGR